MNRHLLKFHRLFSNCVHITLAFLLFNCLITAQLQDTSKHTAQTQYRRGIELQEGYQSYEQKYAGKDLIEEKRRFFPLQSTGVWTELNPKVPRVDYIGIHFVNKDTGWACGDLGAIIKTTDGGQNWTVSQTNTTSLILKIFSLDAQLVIATGYDGLILRSTDGGETFEQIQSGVGTGIDLWGVQIVNDTLGWICGNYETLLKTTDAGLSWQSVTAGLNQHYWSLDFLNENFGMIACGNGFVLKTTDGGNNWIQIETSDTRALYSIYIIDSLHIAAAGGWGNDIQYEGGKNVYSTDAGLTWVLNPDIPTYTDANWIEFVDADTGYAMMVDKGIYKTTNRGQSWFSVGGGGQWQLVLTEDRTGYSGGDGLNIYKRTDGLENWSRLILNDNFSDVFFVSEQKGFAISWSGLSTPSGLYKTTDGGESWEKVSGAPNGPEILFLDSLTGFIGSNSIYKTTDGGENWDIPNGVSVGARKIFFIDDSIGWAIQSNKIYKTTDQGESWVTQVTAPGAGSFSGISFVDNQYGWASILSRRPFKTTNGGNDWIEQIALDYYLTSDVYFTTYDTGWIIREIGGNNLFKTIDGGVTWNPDPDVIGASRFYFFPGSQHWLIYGTQKYITEDGGNSFIDITDDVPAGFNGFSSITDKLGFAVGDIGLILRYDDTSYVPVELNSFKAEVVNQNVVLTWSTVAEINNKGFEIQKSKVQDLMNDWEEIRFIQGNGTTTEKHTYSFNDESVVPGIYKYRLKQIDFDGSFKYSEEIVVDVTPPAKFNLEQNFPNPFNPETTIRYSIPIVISIPTGRERNLVTLKIYNVLGEEVMTLVNEQQTAGIYEIQFSAKDGSAYGGDGSNLPSGVYIYRLTAGSFSTAKKLLLLK
jgi:photosystem II stability/assembly factor-like uncharacterized protein